MIKLLWNTQNQEISDSSKQNNKDVVDYNWGIYHKKNSDKWIYNILKKIDYKIIQNEQDIEAGDTLIIVDSSVEKKKIFIQN